MKIQLIILCIVICSSLNHARGDILIRWFTTGGASAEGPTGTELVGNIDQTVGYLVQIIIAGTDMTADPPDLHPYDAGDTGLTDGDILAFFDWIGRSDNADGTFAGIETLAVSPSDTLYARIWTAPSSGSGNLPSSPTGLYYFDTAVVHVGSLPTDGTATLWDVGVVDENSDWVVVPEPTTGILLGIGALVCLFHRRNSIHR